jgi:hypothetical protein
MKTIVIGLTIWGTLSALTVGLYAYRMSARKK